MIRLTFHGAAGTVTGSKYLLETDRGRVLFDCGLFQGLKKLRLLNWREPQFDPRKLDAVVLSHAHLDHTGYLPRVVKEGFHREVYCTPPTSELTRLILLDSAKIQEEDAAYANRKGFSKHRPALPLYDTQDAQAALKLLDRQPIETWFEPAPGIRVRYHDAGHLLGSTSMEVEVARAEGNVRLYFSGDVGRYDAPLYYDPQPPQPTDFLICESTYGDREHETSDLLGPLAEVISRGIERGGVILVAAFAIGRAQQLIYLLKVLMKQKRVRKIPIFLDSPMAVDASQIYDKYHWKHDFSEGELSSPRIFGGQQVHLSRTVAQSKQINAEDGPAVIISSSGMMTGGRILHHLRQRLPHAQNTVLLAGYMAAGTRGRRLLDGEPTIRMHGRDIPVRAAIERIPGLSGHADRSELMRWLAPLEAPVRTFVTHGEPESAAALADHLREQREWTCTVPSLGESFDLEGMLQ